MRVADTKLQVAETSAAGVLVRRSWQKHLLTFLMVFGPGLIVMEADNDAGAVSTYMQAGGQYGLHLLWLLVVLLPICYFIQEMVARLGIATGKGHAAMIYERFGKWWGHFSLIDLLAVNFLTLITEFAAISLALSALGVSPYISVPVSALGLTLMVVTGSYLRWERIVIALCLMDLTWFVLAYVVHPDWAKIAQSTVAPGNARGRDHKQSRLSCDCDCGHDHSALAALLPAELRGREAAAFCRFEMGQARHSDWGCFHRAALRAQ